MDVNKIRITNLKRIIYEKHNNSIHRFAKEIGWHSSQFYNLFRGDRSFGQKLARNLELILNIAPLTLDKSADEGTIIDQIAVITQYNTTISIDKNLKKMSPNIFAIEKIIVETHGWPIDKLHGFIMDGESMSPTIQPCSKIIIDISQTKINDGKIYALSKNDEIFIKRVFHQVGSDGYEAKSDNEEYETIYFTAEQNINVIGRVICLLNKML